MAWVYSLMVTTDITATQLTLLYIMFAQLDFIELVVQPRLRGWAIRQVATELLLGRHNTTEVF